MSRFRWVHFKRQPTIKGTIRIRTSAALAKPVRDDLDYIKRRTGYSLSYIQYIINAGALGHDLLPHEQAILDVVHGKKRKAS